MENLEHLLSKHGVLRSFTIAKKMKPSELKKIQKELADSGKTLEEIEDGISKLITYNSKSDILEKNVPGLISEKNISKKSITSNKHTSGSEKLGNDFGNLPEKTQKNIITLAASAITFANENEIDSLGIFFFIQILFSELKISPETIAEYNKKYSKNG